MENIKANWMRDYASLLINLNVDESVYFETSEDIFTAIFDNLILNSWQQNKASSQITQVEYQNSPLTNLELSQFHIVKLNLVILNV